MDLSIESPDNNLSHDIKASSAPVEMPSIHLFLAHHTIPSTTTLISYTEPQHASPKRFPDW